MNVKIVILYFNKEDNMIFLCIIDDVIVIIFVWLSSFDGNCGYIENLFCIMNEIC